MSMRGKTVCDMKNYYYTGLVKTEFTDCWMTVDRVGLEKAKKELAVSIQKGVSFIKK